MSIFDIKMNVVGVDIDGILADLMPAVCDKVNSTYNIAMTPEWFTVEDIAGNKLSDDQELQLELVKYIKFLFYDKDFMSSVSPVDGVAEASKKLYDAGFKIVLITKRFKHLRDITEDWLKEHNIKYHSLVMVGMDGTKSDAVADNNVDYFIDDQSSCLEEASRRSGAILFVVNYPWNTGRGNEDIRVGSFPEMVDILLEHHEWCNNGGELEIEDLSPVGDKCLLKINASQIALTVLHKTAKSFGMDIDDFFETCLLEYMNAEGRERFRGA